MTRAATLMGLLALLACAAFGQTTPAFDVASVKPADANARRLDFRVQPGGRLEVVNQTLRLVHLIDPGHRWHHLQRPLRRRAVGIQVFGRGLDLARARTLQRAAAWHGAGGRLVPSPPGRHLALGVSVPWRFAQKEAEITMVNS
jgi:hypothetical protein